MRQPESSPRRTLTRLLQRQMSLVEMCASKERVPAINLNRRAELEHSLLAWGRHYLPKHFAKPASQMHRWLAAWLDVQRTRGWKLNILAPRGGAKSTLVTLTAALRAAVSGAEPYIWVVSDTRAQAAGHLANIAAELLDNARLARDYPAATGRGPVWRGNQIQLRNGATIEAIGTGQRVRGRRQRAARPTLIIGDDLQNDRHAASRELRDWSRRWFQGLLLPAGTPTTNVVNLATALHRDALALELSRTPGWTSRTFAAITSWPTNMQLWTKWEQLYRGEDNGLANNVEWPGTERSEGPGTSDAEPLNSMFDINSSGSSRCSSPATQAFAEIPASSNARIFYEAHRAALDAGAELLWPEVEDLYTLMCQRAASGRAAFDREKQNIPAAADAAEWPAEFFDDGAWFTEWPATLPVRVMALDPAQGRDSMRGDYSALVLLGIDERGTVYVEGDLRRRPLAQLFGDTVAAFRAFRPELVAVESNMNHELLPLELRREFARAGLLAANIQAVENTVSKEVRIRRWGPLLTQHRVRFRRHSPGTALLVEQMQDFPLATHDDGPDAAELALRAACAIWETQRGS